MKFTDWIGDKDKPKLIITKKVINFVDYRSFEDFVISIYGGDYEFTAVQGTALPEQEANNDSSYSFNVKGEISKYDEATVLKIKSGKYPTYCNRVLLNLLIREKFIEPGEYLIKVSCNDN